VVAVSSTLKFTGEHTNLANLGWFGAQHDDEGGVHGHLHHPCEASMPSILSGDVVQHSRVCWKINRT
jgi:hypothetical protein